MAYAKNVFLRYGLTTMQQCKSGKRGAFLFQNSVVSFLKKFKQSRFCCSRCTITNSKTRFIEVINWAKRTFQNRTFGPVFCRLKSSKYI